MFCGLSWDITANQGLLHTSDIDLTITLTEKAFFTELSINLFIKDYKSPTQALTFHKLAIFFFKNPYTCFSYPIAWRLWTLCFNIYSISEFVNLKWDVKKLYQKPIYLDTQRTVRCYFSSRYTPKRFTLCWWLTCIANLSSLGQIQCFKLNLKKPKLNNLAALRYFLFDIK